MALKSLQTIAGEWHNGQFTALYAYASSGVIKSGLEYEVENCFGQAKPKELIELKRLFVAIAHVPAKSEIQIAREFWSRIHRNADGTPVRARSSGKMKTWITRPSEFKQPVKYGLKQSFYITPENISDWVIAPL